MSTEVPDWTRSENQEVSVTGTAANAKAGALLMIRDDYAILIRELSEWDEETVGKTVKVEAIVRRVPGGPKADNSAKAIQGTATDRDTWVLELKQFEVID
jgi:translation initiation factor 6 (eIF-6)